MKITKLEVSGLYGFKDKSVVDLSETITAFWGGNGTGKTSVIEAVRFVLDGQVKKNTLNCSMQEGYVQAEFSSGDVLMRSISTNGGTTSQKVILNGRKITQQDAAGFMCGRLGISGKNLKTFTSGELNDALAGDVSSILLSYMDGSVEKERVISIITEHEKGNPYVSAKDLKEELESLPDRVDIRTGFASLSSSYAQRRKEAKKNGRTVSTTLASLGNPECEMDRESVEEELKSLRKTASEGAAAARLIEVWTENEKKRTAGAERIRMLDEQLKQITLPEHPRDMGSIAGKKEQIITRLKEAQDGIISCGKEYARLAGIKEALELKKCPFAGADAPVECSTDMSPFIADLKGQMARMKKKEDYYTGQEKSLQKEKESILAEEESARKEAEAMQKAESLKTRIKELEAALPEKTERPKTGTDMEKVNARIKELEETLLLVKKKEKAEALKQEIGKLKKEVYISDTLCKDFAADGCAVSELMKEYTGYLNAAAEKSEALTGIKTVFKHDKKINVWFSAGEDKTLRPYFALSAAERFMAGYTVSDLLMRLSGYTVSISDDLDRMDDENLDRFLSLLCKNSAKYENIIIAGVGHTGTEEILKKHGIHIAEVQKG